MAPRLTDDKETQAYILAVSVLVAGVLQLAAQIPPLRRLGFRFDYNWAASREAVGQIVRSTGPMVIGLAVTQINSFIRQLMAWGLSAPATGAEQIAWLGGAVSYPLRAGRRGGDLLWRAAVSVSARSARHGGGDGDFSRAQPPRRPRPVRSFGPGFNARRAAGAVSRRPGRRRPGADQRPAGAAVVRARRVHGRRRGSRRPDDRLLCTRRVGLLRGPGDRPGVLCLGRSADAAQNGHYCHAGQPGLEPGVGLAAGGSRLGAYQPRCRRCCRSCCCWAGFRGTAGT